NESENNVFQRIEYDTWARDSPLIIWSSFIQQGWSDTPSSYPLRILFWWSYVFGVIVMAAYSAMLVSFLTVVDDGLPFETLQELALLPEYRLGIQESSSLEAFFKIYPFKTYGDKLIFGYTDTLQPSYTLLRQK
ncbi:unnamed protein product, partial [Meganyctiphanes norvegica]